MGLWRIKLTCAVSRCRCLRPHYDGYPAVLVRLPALGEDELRELITDAWRCQAPRNNQLLPWLIRA